MMKTRTAIAAAKTRGFTMVEIAISLAVIGFALVAIIGVLPTGMNVQRDNREETIVDQDETLWMNAIRNGSQGLDDLTNYVDYIQNTVTEFHNQGRTIVSVRSYTYTYTNTFLTNGALIIGLLSTPKILPIPTSVFQAGGYWSNHIVGVFRSLSGPASDKAPQQNADMLQQAFSYRLVSEVIPFCQYNTNWIWTNQPGISATEAANRIAYAAYVKQLTNNLADVRLTFRWPVYPGGAVGNNRQVFRAPAAGSISFWTWANPPPGFPRQNGLTGEPPNQFWFCQPSYFVQGH